MLIKSYQISRLNIGDDHSGQDWGLGGNRILGVDKGQYYCITMVDEFCTDQKGKKKFKHCKISHSKRPKRDLDTLTDFQYFLKIALIADIHSKFFLDMVEPFQKQKYIHLVVRPKLYLIIYFLPLIFWEL